jgi:hypothetical protein
MYDLTLLKLYNFLLNIVYFGRGANMHHDDILRMLHPQN